MNSLAARRVSSSCPSDCTLQCCCAAQGAKKFSCRSQGLCALGRCPGLETNAKDMQNTSQCGMPLGLCTEPATMHSHLPELSQAGTVLFFLRHWAATPVAMNILLLAKAFRWGCGSVPVPAQASCPPQKDKLSLLVSSFGHDTVWTNPAQSSSVAE